MSNVQADVWLKYYEGSEAEYFNYTFIAAKEYQLELIRKDVDNLVFIENPTRRALNAAFKAVDHCNEKHMEKLHIALLLGNFLPMLGKQFYDKNKLSDFISEFNDKCDYINNCTEEDQLIEICKHRKILFFIENPSERVQLEAINKGIPIKYINNPTPKIQEIVLKKDFRDLDYLRLYTPIKKVNEIFRLMVSNPKISKEDVFYFMKYEVIDDRNKLNFFHRYGSPKAKRIALEFALAPNPYDNPYNRGWSIKQKKGV